MRLTATKFRVQNYRNFNDSGWISLDRITTFVGQNESGKTALLKALHKFNPKIENPYNPQQEFPRERFTTEYDQKSPVCQVEFLLSEELRQEIGENFDCAEVPHSVELTRYYDGEMTYVYDTEGISCSIETIELIDAFENFKKCAKKQNETCNGIEEITKELRLKLKNWADRINKSIVKISKLPKPEGLDLLNQINKRSDNYTSPMSDEMIQQLNIVIDHLQKSNSRLWTQLYQLILDEIPVLIYFDNYGLLEGSINLRDFLNKPEQKQYDPSIQTIDALFKLTKLNAKSILGHEKTKDNGVSPDNPNISVNQQDKDLRSIYLKDASTAISKKFNEWYGQRKYTFRLQADGNYFRIWVSDSEQPNVEIELEERSKGFQWFFSFCLLFMAESEEGHKNVILLLDEPGLHLHPIAQQELVKFFEKLTDSSQLIYTTHSPFLIDGENIHRVRPISEGKSGNIQVGDNGWPSDLEVVFPLQAASGCAMVKGLFNLKKNILVEGITDYTYLHALDKYCHTHKKQTLPGDIYITPCGGTKNIRPMACLFLAQKIRPLILLDADSQGKTLRTNLLKDCYANNEASILILSEVLKPDEFEIEDLIGAEMILPIINKITGKEIELGSGKGGLVKQIEGAAKRCKIPLPSDWKAKTAIQFARNCSEEVDSKKMSDNVVKNAEKLFSEIRNRFEIMDVE